MPANKKSKKAGIVAGIVATALLGGAVAVPLTSISLITTIAGVSGSNKQLQADCSPGGNNPDITPVFEGSWINPAEGPYNSPYGMRVNPVTGILQLHSGTDIGAPRGSKILAVADGVVTIAGASTGGNSGYMVAVDHGGGVQSRYVHPYKDEIYVKVGQKVKAGEHLADVGSSGNSTGPHLHFEIRINGQPTDPVKYMKDRGVTLGKDTDEQKSVAAAPAGTNYTIQTAFFVSAKKGKGSKAKEDYPTVTLANGETYRPNKTQIRNVQAVMAALDKRDEPTRARVIALITVLVESMGGYMYANPTVPESLSYPHDRLASDHSSVGLYQQQPKWWGKVPDLMDPEKSTNKFLDALHKIPDWESLGLGEAAQKVQQSAYPDRYQDWVPAAEQYLRLANDLPVLDLSPQSPDCQDPSPVLNAPEESKKKGPDGKDQPKSPEEIRADASKLASEHLGSTKYVEGGRKEDQWDEEGFVYWCYTQAGLRGLPYTDLWTRGSSVGNPQEGDLVVADRQRNRWQTVGIKAGGNYFYTVTKSGTLKLPIPKSAEFYDLAATNEQEDSDD